ncbi:MAG: hypothetical protein AABX32_02675 [Nanoarchaeota archaeon]
MKSKKFLKNTANDKRSWHCIISRYGMFVLVLFKLFGLGPSQKFQNFESRITGCEFQNWENSELEDRNFRTGRSQISEQNFAVLGRKFQNWENGS